jgi:methionyl-tRNA synthetase
MEPWKIQATEPERVRTIMYVALQICAKISIVMDVFLPFTASKLRGMLNLPQLTWDDLNQEHILVAGHRINEAVILFQKIEDAEIDAQIQKLEASKLANSTANKTVPAAKEVVSFEQFSAMDIRVATITAAESVPKTKKLLKLTLDTGLDTRTVVSGIAEHFSPKDIIGQQVCLLANLAPREIKGIQSQGMILMAEDKDGKLRFVQPNAPTWNGGTVN